jgi:SAM-dependent methyltransferase
VNHVPSDNLAATGFSDESLYNSARPNYPTDAIEFLVSVLGVDKTSDVLDLGAGSGIFTRQIATYVGRVTAVEPSPSMREELKIISPEIHVLEGSDITIPLESHSADAIFVAQAFHWFDAPRALREMHRVLVPGGGLGLIWNERDESVEWVHDLSVAMQWDKRQPYEVGSDFSAVIRLGPFRGVARNKFNHSQLLDHEGIYRRVLSTSYVSLMHRSELTELMKDVARVVDKLPEPVVMPYLTDVYHAFANSGKEA